MKIKLTISFILIIFFNSSCNLRYYKSKRYDDYKTVFKNNFILSCIIKYNNLKPTTKEFVPPNKIYLYKNLCSQELNTDIYFNSEMDSIIESVKPILNKKVYIASETMGDLNTLFPDISCITSECLKVYDSKELDKMASIYAKRRIKEDENRKAKTN